MKKIVKKNTKKHYKKHYKKHNKTKRLFGGNGFSIESSDVVLGIPVKIDEAKRIIIYRGVDTVDERIINTYLRGKGTSIRMNRIDGSNGLCILGYNIEKLSHINGPLQPVSDLLEELTIKGQSFVSDIKGLNPGLEMVTLSLYEADPDEIEIPINEMIPYLFTTASV
jgi:hypothetical protein